MEESFFATYGDIIFFAAVALYLIFRMNNVLGKKNDEDEANTNVTGYSAAEATEPQAPAAHEAENIEPGKSAKEALEEDFEKYEFEDEQGKDNIRLITEKNESFSLSNFLEGEKSAFEMVLKAFSDKDAETLKFLFTDKIYKNMSKQIKEFEEKGHEASKTLVSIKVDKVLNAALEGSKAKLKLRFISEQIDVTRDENGEIIDGDPSYIETVEDEWEFERNIKSSNPNWQIVAI